MKKWFVYVLGIITGIILTLTYAVYVNYSSNLENDGLEMFEEPADYMEYAQFEVFQVLDKGCALATADNSHDEIVFLIPNEKQKLYDKQKIILTNTQCAQHVGTFKYSTKIGIERTVPAVKIIEGVDLSRLRNSASNKRNIGKTFFDKPHDCVSRKDFQVKEVLESGDAIAEEIREYVYGYVSVSDLEVLFLADSVSSYYNKQILKAPRGKCARQIGNYKFQEYSNSKTIPIVAFE